MSTSLWLIFAVTIGAGFGIATGNLPVGAGIGAAIGLVLGIALNAAKDKKPAPDKPE
jgi:hypothetical protein